MIPLTLAVPGKYKIVRIEIPGAVRKLSNLGIFVGDVIEVIKPAPGPVIFKKGESRVGIGFGIAMNVMVIPVKEIK